MSQIKIDKGIPIPNDGRGRNGKYPWHQMKVGESFMVEVAGGDAVKKAMNTLSSASYRFGPKKFTVRKVEGGVRCWRTE